MSKKHSPYRYGYLVERHAKQKLEEEGAYVVRSSRSLGMADLIAFFPEKREVWVVQVKKREAPKDQAKLKKEFKTLSELAGEYTIIPLVYMKKDGKYSFIKV